MEWKEVFFNQKSTTGSTTTTTSYGVTLGFIAYLAILLGGLGAVFTIFMKNSSLGGLLAFFCGLIMIGFGICIFFIPSMFADKNEAIAALYNIKLTVAPILGGVFAIPVLKKVL